MTNSNTTDSNTTTPVTNSNTTDSNTTTPVTNSSTTDSNTTTPVTNSSAADSNTTTPVANSTDTSATNQACTAADINQELLPYNATQVQKDMLEWHNKARTNPSSLISDLTAMLANFGGTDDKVYLVPGGTSVVTYEGKAAVQEAITFLTSATNVTALKWDQLLEFAARDLAVA
mgnify:CR=1 FL=1